MTAGLTPDELDELRESLGARKEQIDAYDAYTSPYKVGRKWCIKLVDGSDHPGLFTAKHEAITAAGKHKQLKRDQYEHPERYTSVTQVRARKRIKRADELMRDYGKTETEAYQIAYREASQRGESI